MVLNFKNRKLKGLITKVNRKLKNEHNPKLDLMVYGVTKKNGLSITGNLASIDLSEYIVVEGNTFAYNPYRINIGSIGLSNKDFKGLISPAYIAFTTTSELSAEFLFFYLKSVIGLKLINWYGNRGGVRNALRFDDLEEIDIPDLSLDEQKQALKLIKSGNKFNEAFQVEVKQQQIDLDKLRRAILNDAINGQLIQQNSFNEPASVLLKTISEKRQDFLKVGNQKIKKHTNIDLPQAASPSDLPLGWARCEFDYLARIVGGGTPSKNIDEFWKGDIPWVTPKDMKSQFIIDSKDHISESAIKNSSAKWIEKGAILVVVRGMVLTKAFPVAINTKPITINQDMKALIPFDDRITDYLYLFLTAFENDIMALVERSTHGTGKLDTHILKNMTINLPPLNEQREILKKVDDLLKTCQKLDHQIKETVREADSLIQAILTKAFSTNQYKSIDVETSSQHRILLLATEIIWKLHQTPTFGHVKLQKLIFLCQKTKKMDLPVNFLKQAMGPYDPKLQRYLDAELEKRGWFKYDEAQTLKYQPLANVGGHKLAFKAHFGEQMESIYHLIHLFEDTNSARIEIVATLFACWEELILNNHMVNDASLLSKFYEWSEFKGNYSAEQVKSALRWMESNSVVPQQSSILN